MLAKGNSVGTEGLMAGVISSLRYHHRFLVFVCLLLASLVRLKCV